MGLFFLTSPSIGMGWGPGIPTACSYPKSWQVNPPPPVIYVFLQKIWEWYIHEINESDIYGTPSKYFNVVNAVYGW